MIAFRNYVNGTKVADWQDDGGDNIAFSPEPRASSPSTTARRTRTRPTRHPSPTANTATCTPPWTAKTVTVKGGKVETTVPARSAIALYAGATKASHPAASAATDPSDPDVSQEEDDALPDDKSITIYYKPADS